MGEGEASRARARDACTVPGMMDGEFLGWSPAPAAPALPRCKWGRCNSPQWPGQNDLPLSVSLVRRNETKLATGGISQLVVAVGHSQAACSWIFSHLLLFLQPEPGSKQGHCCCASGEAVPWGSSELGSERCPRRTLSITSLQPPACQPRMWRSTGLIWPLRKALPALAPALEPAGLQCWCL